MDSYDLIVVGGGPAGMTAALYALRNGKRVLLLEKNAFGGQMNDSPRIENYPGVPSVSGLELAVGAVCRVMLHTAVWDYTGEWGNLAGLVCPKYTLYWFLLCGWVIFVLRYVESTVYHPQKSLSDG